MQILTPTQARAALAAAQEKRSEIQREYHRICAERGKARDVGDVEQADILNAQAGRLNTDLHFALSAVQEANNGIDRARGELQRRLNAVASLSGEVERTEQQLREAEERVRSLTPEVARLRPALEDARQLLADFQADEPPPEPAAAPEPKPVVERDPVWPQPALVRGAGRADAQYFMRDGTRCDPSGRPLEGVESTSAPVETPAKADPMAPQTAPSLWE